MSAKDAAVVPLYCCFMQPIEGQHMNGMFYSQAGIYGDKVMQKGGMPMLSELDVGIYFCSRKIDFHFFCEFVFKFKTNLKN